MRFTWASSFSRPFVIDLFNHTLLILENHQVLETKFEEAINLWDLCITLAICLVVCLEKSVS